MATRLISMILASAAMGGCAVREPVVFEPLSATSRQESVRNYTIGKPGIARVGESIVRVKDHTITVSSAAMTPEQTFTFRPGFNMTFNAGEIYPIRGIVRRGTSKYTAVWHTFEHYGVLVAEDGSVHSETLSVSKFYGPYPLAPANARMKPVIEERVDLSKPHTNYEIVYDGMSPSTLSFVYREFEAQDSDKTRSSQDLMYDAKVPTIRFRNLRIKVLAASNEQIEYTVLEDQ